MGLCLGHSGSVGKSDEEATQHKCDDCVVTFRVIAYCALDSVMISHVLNGSNFSRSSAPLTALWFEMMNGDLFKSCALTAALMMSMLCVFASPAAAQSITQRMELVGWSATGNELINRVTIASTGIDDNGDPIDWQYTVLEITSTQTGKVLSRFRDGAPRGKEQKAWLDAKDRTEGERRIEALGLLTSQRSSVSPKGDMALQAYTAEFPQPMTKMVATCPGCHQCTATLQLHLIDRQNAKVYKLKTHQRTGEPYSPDGPQSCPKLAARVQWHPQAQRFAVVYQETLPESGAIMERLRIYTPSRDADAWETTPIASNTREDSGQRLKSLIESTKAVMADTSDPIDQSILMARLGDLNRRLGNTTNAEDYYKTALEFDKRNTQAVIGQAILALQGADERLAGRLIRKAEMLDRRMNLYQAQIGLYYTLAGQPAKAATFFERAERDRPASFEDRVALVEQVLDFNLNLGVQQLSALLASPPDDAPKDRLGQLRVTLIEHSVRLGDLATAADQLAALPEGHPDKIQLALLISAESADDPKRLGFVVQKARDALEQDPGQCRLYTIAASALLKTRRAQDAMETLGAALACNPRQATALLLSARLHRDAGQSDVATARYESYLDVAVARPGDPVRSAGRREARDMLKRLGHSGIVVTQSACTSDNGQLRCKGVLRNTSPEARGPIEVELTLYSGGRRAGAIAREVITLSQVLPRAKVDFNVAITLPTAAVNATLIVGADPADRALNKIDVPLN